MNQYQYAAGRGGHRHQQITIQTEAITYAKDTSQIYSLFNTSGGLFLSPLRLERVLHASTGKQSLPVLLSRLAEEFSLNFQVSNLIIQPAER